MMDGDVGSRPPWSGQTGWHFARWGPLGWLETSLKLVAIGIAIAAAGRGGAWAPGADHAVTFGCLVALTLGYSAAIADRWVDREIVSMAFVFAVVAGHGAALYASGSAAWPRASILGFAGLMLAGDLVKISFFLRTGARVRDLPRVLPIAMTAIVVAAYAAILLDA